MGNPDSQADTQTPIREVVSRWHPLSIGFIGAPEWHRGVPPLYTRESICKTSPLRWIVSELNGWLPLLDYYTVYISSKIHKIYCVLLIKCIHSVLVINGKINMKETSPQKISSTHLKCVVSAAGFLCTPSRWMGRVWKSWPCSPS